LLLRLAFSAISLKNQDLLNCRPNSVLQL